MLSCGLSAACAALLWTRRASLKSKDSSLAGFFFGVRRNIQKWAFDEDNLFNPGNRLFAQEQVHQYLFLLAVLVVMQWNP